MSDLSFDPSLFTRPPVINVLSGITLAETLTAAVPKELRPELKKPLHKLDTARRQAKEAWAERQRRLGPGGDDPRLIDGAADRAWSALRDRLAAYAALPAEEIPAAARAQALLALLFPEGLEFTHRTYAEQLAIMDAMLHRIDEEGLARELDALCGADFLDHVRDIQPRYRAMVQAGLLRGEPAGNLLEHVRAIGQAVVEYAIRVAATVDQDRPETVERALQALAPISALRDQSARRGGDRQPPPEPPPAAPPAAPTDGPG